VPGKTIILRKDRIEQRGTDDYSWFGKVEGYELSTVTLTVVDGITYGNISMAGELYSIEPYAGGYVVTKLDPTRFDTLINDEMVPPALISAQSAAASGAIVPLADTGTQIDLMVLYTPQMQTAYGSGLAAKIQSLVDYANVTYNNSGITTQLKLLGSLLYSNANAVEGISLNTALNTITNDGQVGIYRDAAKADLVTLLRVFHQAEGDGCGLAWVTQDIPGYSPYGFSVVKVGTDGIYLCYDKTLVHELGHNMGCAHDRAHASVAGAYPFSYGYDNVAAVLTTPLFATIMSYVPNPIQYFSTPLITYSGVPIGVAGSLDNVLNPTTSADNARSINLTRVLVSNYEVSFCSGARIRNSSTGLTYNNIGGSSGAYAAAATGNTLQLIASGLVEDALNLNRAINVTLAGGYDCGFTVRSSVSTIIRSVTVSAGSLTADGIVIM
jgi:hypothetical protein